MLDLLALQQVMSNPPISFSKFPSAHVLTDKKSYRRWLKQVRYYLSCVNPFIPLYIIDSQISSNINPSQHSDYISICNIFFLTVLLTLFLKTFWIALTMKHFLEKMLLTGFMKRLVYATSLIFISLSKNAMVKS